MEVILTSVAANVAGKVAGYLVDPIVRSLGNLFNYRSNLDELVEQVGRLGNARQRLCNARERLQHDVDEANRQGDDIKNDVRDWLTRTEGIITRARVLIEDENAENTSCLCFNLTLGCQRSRQAKELSGDISKLQEKFDREWSARLRDCKALESRESTLNEIMEALRNDDIRMIGVWGMGGVGKTTLANQVAKKAEDDKLFEKVVMALKISRDPNVTKIQGEIASMLGLKLEEGDEKGRAVRLSQRLKKHKKILVILDDVWEPIEFERIGIPYGSDVGYCKVLLTSRNCQVHTDMETHKNFHVKHLCQEEAWSLFKQKAGDSVEKPEFRSIAVDVVKKCEGLPLAIVIIAKALKGEKVVGVWRNALKELKRCAPTNIRGVSKNVYSCLELSYNHLESDEVKSLFLLCGLLGDGDISLDDLLKYGMGLDLFDYRDSLEQARDKIVSLVKILQDSSLLLDSLEDVHYRKPSSLFFVEEGNAFVRMHDMVCDVAKAIASKDPHHQFVVNEDVRLQEWVKGDGELRNCTRISLKCTQVHELPELVCPKLRIFLLNHNYICNYNSLKIPDTFFKEMKEVRVLSLCGLGVTQLPSSLHFLSNLRTLCLHHCGELKDIAILGGLKKLQFLSLEGCQIQKLPEEMMQLTDLRMLSLRVFSIFVPRIVISSLSRLEHLSVIIYSISGRVNDWLYGLKPLSCLRALELRIVDSGLLPPYVSFENLTRYAIFIGYKALGYDDKRNLRRLTLDGVKGPRLVKCFSRLLKTVEVLELGGLDDTKHFVYELDNDGFRQLKYLSINGGSELQYIMNTIEMEGVDPPHSAFPLLEELRLDRLYNLEAVCHGPIPIGCFANLRILIIESCYRLKYILWLPTAQGRESVLVFPQLRFLELTWLPDLIDFYSIGSSRSQEPFIPLFNQKVALPGLELLRLRFMQNVRTVWDNQHPVGSSSKLKNLYLDYCKNLLTVFPSNFLKGLQSLQILEIENCCSLKEIFEVGEINREKSDGITIPQLKEMPSHGQNIKSVKKKDPQGYLAFQNLNSLKVGKCASLRYIFPTSVAKGLVQLEVLEISNCGVEEIVANENGLEAAPIFLFPRLNSLKLIDLHQLKRFYRGMYTLRCPLLKELVVRNCDEVELLLQEKSLQGEVDKQPLFLVEKDTFPNVEELKLGFKGPMEIWWGQFSRESFGKLRVLEIEACDDISVVIPHNIEQLIVRSCDSVEKVIQVEGHAGETLPRLTIMYLENLPMLRHLSGFGSILQNLQSLRVSRCRNLINLVSPSMAKRLVQLKELTVDSCDEVKEIVENEGGEATDDEILFTKLQKLELSFLPNLKSFCSARYTFKFPCLIEMKVIKCPKMEFFCKGDAITESLQRVEMDYHQQRWENDLNTTIQKMFMETNAEPMEEDFEEYGDFEELDPKEEDSEDEVPDEEDDEEGDSEEQHPNVEDSEGRVDPWGQDPDKED